MESTYNSFTKNIITIGIANGLVQLSGFILLPLLTKTLGASGYGIWSQVQISIALGELVAGLDLSYALVRFLPSKTKREEIQEEFYSIFFSVFFFALIITTILLACSSFLAEQFFNGATQITTITVFIILVWTMDRIFLTFFRAFRQMKKYSVFLVAMTYGEAGLIAYLLLTGHGILSVVTVLLIIRTALFFVLFFLIKSEIGFKRPHFLNTKEYLNFSIPTIPGNISQWVAIASDRYVIGYFLGITSVGIYSTAYSIGNILFIISGILGFVLVPTLSKLYDEGKIREVQTLLAYSVKYSLAVGIPFVSGAAILSEPILKLLSTNEIASQGCFVLPVIALSTLFFLVCVLIANILVLVKKMRTGATIWIITAVVNLGLNILLVPHFGIFGAAINTLIAYSLALALTAYYSFKEFKFSINWLFIIKSIIASAIMSIIVWLIHPQNDLVTIITVLVGIIIYGIALFLLKGFSRAEISFIMKLIIVKGSPAN